MMSRTRGQWIEPSGMDWELAGRLSWTSFRNQCMIANEGESNITNALQISDFHLDDLWRLSLVQRIVEKVLLDLGWRRIN